jgi:hypothetical protein
MSMSVGETTLMQDIGSYLRHRLRGWRGMIAAAVILAVPALWVGWPWLVAAGLAPIILAAAPCAVMCAAGLCMNRVGKKPAVSPDTSEGVDTMVQRFGPGAEQERSQTFGTCCADSGSPAETIAPNSPVQSIQPKKQEMIQ